MTASKRAHEWEPKTPQVEVEHATGYGPRDYQRGNQAHSVCAHCGYSVAIPHFLKVDGEHKTICECSSCGALAL